MLSLPVLQCSLELEPSLEALHTGSMCRVRANSGSKCRSVQAGISMTMQFVCLNSVLANVMDVFTLVTLCCKPITVSVYGRLDQGLLSSVMLVCVTL